MVPIVFGADSINIHECAGFRVKISKFLVNTISRRRKVRLVSYLGGRSPIVSRWSLLFLVSISLIFMSGRGLEINLSNADILRTKCPIHFQLGFVTSLGNGTRSHAMELSYLIDILEWAGLRSKTSQFLVNMLSGRGEVRLVSYLGGRLPLVSRWSLLFLVLISIIFPSGRGLE